jgi:hypothetical protein
MAAPAPRLAAPISPAPVLGRQRFLGFVFGKLLGRRVQLIEDAGAGACNASRSAGRTCNDRQGGCSGNPYQSSQK